MARITRDTLICGVPAHKLRDAAREISKRNLSYSPQVIGEVLGLTPPESKRVFKALKDGDYIGPDPNDARKLAETVNLGAVRVAKFIKPISRERLEELLDGVIARVEENNADPERSHNVLWIAVFGSYWRKQSDYGDLDLVVEMAMWRDWGYRNWDQVGTIGADQRAEKRIKAGERHLSLTSAIWVPKGADLRKVWTAKAGRLKRPVSFDPWKITEK